MLVRYLKKHKIRKVVFWFSVCLACVLFQTDVMSIGTISSLFILCMFYIYFFFGEKMRMTPSSGALLLFIGLVYIMTIICNREMLDLNKFAIQSFMCVCCFSIILSEKEYHFSRKMYIMFMIFNCFMCIYGIFHNPLGLLLHDSVNMYGTLFDPNFLGIPFVAASVLCLDYGLHKKQRWFYIPFIILFITIIITASRGSLLAFVFANGLLFLKFSIRYFRKMLKYSIFIILIFVTIFSVVNEYVFSVADNSEKMEKREDLEGADNGRFALWSRGLVMFEESPIFGNGLNGFYERVGHANHNTYMQVLTATGLVGTTIFVWFIIQVLKRAYRRDYSMFCLLMGLFLQIAFLDALSSRFLWPLVSLAVMSPRFKLKKITA